MRSRQARTVVVLAPILIAMLVAASVAACEPDTEPRSPAPATIAVRPSLEQLPEISAAITNGTVVASFGEGGDQVQVLRVQPDRRR
jgi:hypothetical protein